MLRRNLPLPMTGKVEGEMGDIRYKTTLSAVVTGPAGQYHICPMSQPPLSVCFMAPVAIRAKRSQVCFCNLHTPPALLL